MGVFTFGYAQIRAAGLMSKAKARLESLAASDAGRPSLEHYVKYGVLQSQTYARPVDFEQYAVVPRPDDKVRWASAEQAFVVGFDLPPEMFPSKDEENGGVMVQANIAYRFEAKPVETSSWRPSPFPEKAP